MPKAVSRLAFFRYRHLAGVALNRPGRVVFKINASFVYSSDHEVRHV